MSSLTAPVAAIAPHLTPEVVAFLERAAGPDYGWSGTRGTSRPTSDVKVGLRLWLAEQAGGVCVFCGCDAPAYDPVTGEPVSDLAHIVSKGTREATGERTGKGWTAGNLANGCQSCNDWQAYRGPVVEWVSIMYPERIPTAWPATPVLRDMGRAFKAGLHA